MLKLKHLHTHSCLFCAASSTGIGNQVQLKKKLTKCARLVQEVVCMLVQEKHRAKEARLSLELPW